MNEKNKIITISISGMHCASCVNKIEQNLKKIIGIKNVSVNLTLENAYIEFSPNLTSIKEIKEVVTSLGYKVVEGGKLTDASVDLKNTKINLILSAVFSFFVLIFSMFNFPFSHKIENIINFVFLFFLTTIVQFVFGWQFIKGAYFSLKNKYADMNTLVAVGTLSAYIYSVLLLFFPHIFSMQGHQGFYFDTSTVIITLILLGKFLESKSKKQTVEAIKKLLNLQPQTAIILKENKEIEVQLSEVKLNDILVVKPGSKIAVDGILTEGNSAVDESMLTGESIPVEKNEGSEVYAGTINISGSFKFKAIKIGEETFLANIVKFVETAQATKAPIQKLTDKIAAYFVPIVILIAIITFIFWFIFGDKPSFNFALTNFISVLIIACPCALGLATPTAVVVATGKAAQQGILIRNSDALEKVNKATTIVFDKTGTLTLGKIKVQEILIIDNNFSKDEILSFTASIEDNSLHPVSKAITSYAKENNIEFLKVKDFSQIAGLGVKGKIHNKEILVGNEKFIKNNNIEIASEILQKVQLQKNINVFVTLDNKLAGIIFLADTIKPEAKETIEKIKKLNLKPYLLTGDNKLVAEEIALSLEINNWTAEVLPQKKAEVIKEMQKQGEIVAFVGDGINDSPALTIADVGIALSTGSDIAMESSDITLLKGNLTKVLQSINLSKNTVKIIKQNLFWAFFYNIIGIPIAAGILYPFTGWLLNPMLASVAMAFSSVSVVSNSLRLKKAKI